MTTTYDIGEEPNPIEAGVQQVYTEVRESLALILLAWPKATPDEVLTTLDDAVSNNWDDLMASFWKAAAVEAGVLTPGLGGGKVEA